MTDGKDGDDGKLGSRPEGGRAPRRRGGEGDEDDLGTFSLSLSLILIAQVGVVAVPSGDRTSLFAHSLLPEIGKEWSVCMVR